MEKKMDYTPEELQEMLKKAEKEAQMALDRMTPEERRQAEINAAKLMEEDRVAKQKLLDEAAQFVAGHGPAHSSERGEERAAVKFCPNCGAKVNGTKFCEYCGTKL